MNVRSCCTALGSWGRWQGLYGSNPASDAEVSVERWTREMRWFSTAV